MHAGGVNRYLSPVLDRLGAANAVLQGVEAAADQMNIIPDTAWASLALPAALAGQAWLVWRLQTISDLALACTGTPSTAEGLQAWLEATLNPLVSSAVQQAMLLCETSQADGRAKTPELRGPGPALEQSTKLDGIGTPDSPGALVSEAGQGATWPPEQTGDGSRSTDDAASAARVLRQAAETAADLARARLAADALSAAEQLVPLRLVASQYK